MGTGMEGSIYRDLEAHKLGRCPNCHLVVTFTIGQIEKGAAETKDVYHTKTCTNCGAVQEIYQNSHV
jgi:hypothetical protein